MKKAVVAIVSACMLFSASSAVFAAAPVTEKTHEQKLHQKKIIEEKAKMKMHSKSGKVHSKGIQSKSIKAKSLKAKAVNELPKTGLGGASEQTE